MPDASPQTRDVVIIGSGPAGLTAATYAARANLEPLVIEGMVVGGPTGGQLTLTTDVENYPGFPEGIMGPDLIQGMRAQAERFGTTFWTEDATAVDLDQRPFRIQTASQEVYANALIISTGAKPRRLEVPGEDELWGGGVSACATCDGFFFRDQHVVVVGGGDSAMEEATFLTKFASSVTVIHRRDELRASKIMQERALKNDRIEFLWDTEIDEILGDKGQVSGVRIRNTRTGEAADLACDGVFLAIGHIPNTELFDDWLDTDEDGYLRVEHPTTRTNVAGVFASGDVMDHTYRQAVTAAGTGCKAAMDAERYLAEMHS
ncbi:MAG TPA: thioredoxin-disulfide reductase [Nitriliruptorales bacterium]